VLRLIHIGFGVFWVGAVLFIAAFLIPSIRDAGPAGGAVMRQLVQGRKLPLWLMGASLVTLLSGFGLYWVDSAGFRSSEWLGSGTGRIFGLGGLLALIAGVLGSAVNAPAAKRLGQLAAAIQAAGRPPAPEEAAEIGRLQQRLNRTTYFVAVLLLLATLAMAVARYVP
jgi:hypothetical protein